MIWVVNSNTTVKLYAFPSEVAEGRAGCY